MNKYKSFCLQSALSFYSQTVFALILCRRYRSRTISAIIIHDKYSKKYDCCLEVVAQLSRSDPVVRRQLQILVPRFRTTEMSSPGGMALVNTILQAARKTFARNLIRPGDGLLRLSLPPEEFAQQLAHLRHQASKVKASDFGLDRSGILDTEYVPFGQNRYLKMKTFSIAEKKIEPILGHSKPAEAKFFANDIRSLSLFNLVTGKYG